MDYSLSDDRSQPLTLTLLSVICLGKILLHWNYQLYYDDIRVMCLRREDGDIWSSSCFSYILKEHYTSMLFIHQEYPVIGLFQDVDWFCLWTWQKDFCCAIGFPFNLNITDIWWMSVYFCLHSSISNQRRITFLNTYFDYSFKFH